jgi:hypothetical protein
MPLLPIFELHSVWILELGPGFDEVDPDLLQLLLVSEIDPLNVILDVGPQGLPVVLKWVALLPPAIILGHLNAFFDLGGYVEELFRNTTYIDACAAEAPS